MSEALTQVNINITMNNTTIQQISSKNDPQVSHEASYSYKNDLFIGICLLLFFIIIFLCFVLKMVLSRNRSQRSSSQTKKSKSKSSSNPLDFSGPKLGQSIPQDESRAQSLSKDAKLSDSNSIDDGTQPSDFSVNSPALRGNLASQQIKRLNFSGFNKKTLTKQKDSQEDIHLTKIPSLKKSKSLKYDNDIIKNQSL